MSGPRTSFTARLTRSMLGFLVLAVVALAAIVWLQRDRVAGAAFESVNGFVPQRSVVARVAVANALISPSKETPSLETCPERALQIVGGRLSMSAQLLGGAWASANRSLPDVMSCRAFLEHADWISRQSGLLQEASASRRSAWIEAASTERVSWEALPPCLMASDAQGRLLALAGSRGRCPAEGLAHRLPESTQALGRWVYRRALAAESVDGRAQAPVSLALSVDGQVQSRLDAMQSCFINPQLAHCTQAEVALASRLQHYAVVVMHSASGAILGLHCQGRLCEQAGIEGSEPVAALLAQSPPASTAKLFVSMALGAAGGAGSAGFGDPSVRRDLALQIKTSGQLDDSVTKRNEWWERSMLCDLRPTRSAGNRAKTSSSDFTARQCRVPGESESIATALGFNQECPSGRCGRVNLGTMRLDMPGFMGSFRPVEPFALRDAKSSQKGNTRADDAFMGWDDYEAIRAGRAKPPRPPADRIYLRTSYAVQSVIGAGDARVSALGLAHLAGQVGSLAAGKIASMPWLVRRMDSTTTTMTGDQSPLTTSPMASRSRTVPVLGQSQAQSVWMGMAKVTQPAEPGWQGGGTAYPALQAVWSDKCKAGCSVWGKTGTVGRADKVFAGTTTFAGAWDPQRIGTELDYPALEMRPARTGLWTVGVIVQPDERTMNSPASGHLASRLGLLVIDRLAREEREQREEGQPLPEKR